MDPGMRDERDCETQDIYNSIRRYGFWVLFTVLVVLLLADLGDDLFLGNRYVGPPMWLVSIIGGCMATLFGARIIDGLRK